MKKLFSILLFIFSFFASNALPGFKPYIQDFPGDYVFYRDYSFKSETYVGFLYYGNSAYSAKIITLKDEKSKNLEKSVSIYFTVDESKDFMEFTGEKVISMPTEDDIHLVNYLHDLIYDFNSKRIKTGKVDSENVIYDEKDFLNSGYETSDFLTKFGGDVKILYDWVIPLFNLKSIKDFSENVQFEVATVGRISSSENNEFDNFKGFSKKSAKNNFKIPKKAEKIDVKLENAELKIDSNWNHIMENVWFLKDKAGIFLSKLQAKDLNIDFIFKQMLMNPVNSFYNWKNFSVKKDSDSFLIDGLVFDSDKKRNSKNLIKVIKNPQNENEFYSFNSSIFESAFKKNEKYFYQIRDNFKLVK